MVERQDTEYTVTEQCELLGISRSGVYYVPTVSERKIEIMNYMDEIYTDDPTSGQRKILAELGETYGIKAGRDLIRTLMRKMGLRAIHPGPRTTVTNAMHRKYPYLLRGVKVTHVNQVWSTDITYIRLKHGFVYLTAIIDWYSRRILAWRLSNSLSSDFCVEVLLEAVGRYGWPEVFNTDQGCQYTSEKFTKLFEDENCTAKLSMDGKGRSLDNVYIERFWRTLKYEDVYLKGYTDMKACYRGIKAFIDRYNDRRRHSSLDNHTPSEVYFNHVVLKPAA